MTQSPRNRKCKPALLRGLCGMPLALSLSEGLGIRVLKQRIDVLFKKHLVPFYACAPFFGYSVFVANCRCLAICFPCLLIPVSSVAGDKAAEDFNGSAVRQEGLLDMSVNVWPVVGSVVSRNVDECKGWGESGPKGCAGSPTFCDSQLFQGKFMLLPDQMQGKPVGDERPKQSAEGSGKQLIGHGGYISWAVLLFLGSLLAGSELMLLALRRKWIRMPNVRAKRATTAGRQGPATDNVQRTCGRALVACRWRSA
jgi:hypothetical protein